MSKTPVTVSSRAALCAAAAFAILASACAGGKGSKGGFPENFKQRPDTAQVGYVMRNASPDSLARFICLAAIGKIQEAQIDSLPQATVYAYENLRDSALGIFSDEFDRCSNSLPLTDRMRLLAMAGTMDPHGIGYDLGLHYVDQIRTRNMSPQQVETEIEEFRKACGQDTATYERFLKGFQVVLELDKGRDLSPEIYNRYKKIR